MSTLSLRSGLEEVLGAKLEQLTVQLGRNVIRRIDLGVFPWHGTLEISFLLADDICDERDIASWPQYNVSQIAEGKWPEAVELCKEMQRQWLTDANLSEEFLVHVGKACHSQRVRTAIASINWEGEPRITVFDPDKKNSRNYAD